MTALFVAPETFDKFVNGGKAALVEFYAPWYEAPLHIYTLRPVHNCPKPTVNCAGVDTAST